MMNCFRLAAFAAFCVSAVAQVTEVPAMSVGFSLIDLDASSLGTTGGVTTLAALRSAGTNGGAPLAAIRLQPNLAASGIYNTNPELGRGLARRASDNGLLLCGVYGSFDAFDAEFDFDFPSTEFGISIGDWLGSMVLDFYSQGVQIDTITSTPYVTSNAKFFQSANLFDQVRVRANAATANWVIPQLYFQSQGPWRLYGQGCPGSNGIPSMALNALPRLGSVYAYTVLNMPLSEVFFLNVYGMSSNLDPTLGALPASLNAFGAPGCFANCEINFMQFVQSANGTSTISLPIPNLPGLANVTFMHQAYPFDPTINSLEFTSSRAVRVVILAALSP
ncbi:hypothetical protein LBMAG49_15230 [Planctomycetota bacterium]|nr:hypothetical protein LBMAG49_15230 [Planctomycetota bacterium]